VKFAFTFLIACAPLLALIGCANSLDMSGSPLGPPGPDEGVVIGSVLVRADLESPASWFNRVFGRKAAGFTYDFEIVGIESTDPRGERPFADRYELDARPGEERFFLARLKAGDYLMKSFRHEGLSAMGARLDLMFSVTAGTVSYLGRLLIDVPQRVTLGTDFTFKVEDAREATLATLRKTHPELVLRVTDAPMQTRCQPGQRTGPGEHEKCR
jgi:hypothetical protein